ncbi:MAG TPA: hypothetical protein PKE65_04000, partial [Rhizobiaceae bacterium]|nr:hypothetical protein [Rhizobiaceae bacterium]
MNDRIVYSRILPLDRTDLYPTTRGRETRGAFPGVTLRNRADSSLVERDRLDAVDTVALEI